MTCDEIRISAQLVSGLQISDVTSLKWVVEAMTLIARQHPLAATKKTVSVTVEEDEEYSIVEDLVRLESIVETDYRRPLGKTTYSCDEKGNITFWVAGDYDITYRYVPTMPTVKTGVVVIPEIYASAIQYYVASKIRGRIFGQGDNDVAVYSMKFESELMKADTGTNSTNRRHRRIPVRY